MCSGSQPDEWNGAIVMATIRPVQQRFHFGWIAAGLIGVLLGVLVMVGVGALQSPSTSSDTAAVPAQTNPDLTFAGPGLRDQQAAEQPASGVDGGLAGGITSADTPNDAAFRAGLAKSAASAELPWSDEEIFSRQSAAQQATTSGLLPDLDETTRYREQTPAASLAPSDSENSEHLFSAGQGERFVPPPYESIVNRPQ